MKYKRTVIAAAVTLAVVVSIHYMSGSAKRDETLAGKHGIVNPDIRTAGMSHEPMPQVSERRFTPKPSLAVGSHIDPNYQSKQR
jgi:hypothetical protein